MCVCVCRCVSVCGGLETAECCLQRMWEDRGAGLVGHELSLQASSWLFLSLLAFYLNPEVAGVFKAVGTLHFSSFAVLNVCHPQRMLCDRTAAGPPPCLVLSPFLFLICRPWEMLLALGTQNLEFQAGWMKETLT